MVILSDVIVTRDSLAIVTAVDVITFVSYFTACFVIYTGQNC